MMETPEPSPSRTGPPPLLVALSIAYLLVWLGVQASTVLIEVLIYNPFPADGPFQLLNPLRRIAAGQQGGVDFQFFHGLGVPYLHYPLYAWLGQSVFAAEFARQSVSIALFVASTVFFFLAAARDIRWTLLLTSIAFALSKALDGLIFAGNNLMGVRSTMPVVIATLFFLPLSTGVHFALSSVALGIALFLGTEHGVAAFIAFVFTGIIRAYQDRSIRSIGWSVLAVIAGGSVYVLLLGAVGGASGAIAALRYAFRDVIVDQFWYFGSPPNAFIVDWSHFVRDLHLVRVLAIGPIALIVCLVLRARDRDPARRRVALGASFYILYGLGTVVSYFGIASKSYLRSLERALLFSLIAVVFLWGPGMLARVRDRLRPKLSRVAFAFIALLIVVDAIMTAGLFATGIAYRKWSSWFGSPGPPRLAPAWESNLAVASATLGPPETRPRIWSTYAGLAEAAYGEFHPSYDYIIHALGPERRAAYLEEFDRFRPRHVQTLRTSLFRYEEWLRVMHWDFYERVLRDYRVVSRTGYSLWWERNRTAPLRRRFLGTVPLRRDGDVATFSLRGDHFAPRIAVLHLEYAVHNPWHRVPMAGQWPRFLVVIAGAQNTFPVALSPYRTRTSIPIFFTRPDQNRAAIAVATASLLPGTSVAIRSATLELIELDRDNEAFVADPWETRF